MVAGLPICNDLVLNQDMTYLKKNNYLQLYVLNTYKPNKINNTFNFSIKLPKLLTCSKKNLKRIKDFTEPSFKVYNS